MTINTAEKIEDQLHAPGQSAQAEAEPVYAVIEVFGHRRLTGRITEVEQYGTKLLRIDIPEKGKFENGFKSQLYGGASLFSVTHCDLATVERMNSLMSQWVVLPIRNRVRSTRSKNQTPTINPFDKSTLPSSNREWRSECPHASLVRRAV